jgi:hypothetical protein
VMAWRQASGRLPACSSAVARSMSTRMRARRAVGESWSSGGESGPGGGVMTDLEVSVTGRGDQVSGAVINQ